jgi:acyl-coenzyme A synthetase/AMP-(fatty) acid ligase
MDDMLKPGGRWLSPLEVENILLEHAAVREAAVVGANDKAGLEKPVAFVVLRAGWEPSESLEHEIQDMVRSATSSYKCPRRVFFAAELPRTPSGKIQRYRLRERLWSDGPAI